jgi:molybdenum cofactor cytidylyltransferase
MFSSILCGMEKLSEQTEGVLVALGDQPQIQVEDVRQVVACYRAGNKGIVIPTSNGKRGHPALIDIGRYLDEIRSLSGAEGLKPLMRGHPEDTMEICVDQDRILRDMDTPDDYRSELGRSGLSE